MIQFRDPAVVAIVQARMNSSRFPGKVLAEVGDQPMLAWVSKRARRAQRVGRLVIATTTDISDDPVAKFCQQKGIACFRGHPTDVLDRYYQAARLFDAEIVVRLTADCPLIDPAEVDRVLIAFMKEKVDFAANRLPPPWQRTTPIGMDTEVISLAALTRAWQEAEAPYAREHVMPYIYEEPGRFNYLLVNHEPDWGHLRLTVDTPQDLDLIRAIAAHFDFTDDFSLEEIVDYLHQHPELLSLNADVAHNPYNSVDRRP